MQSLPTLPNHCECAVKSGFKYVYQFYGNRYRYFITQETRDDAFGTIRLAVIEAWLKGIDGKDANGIDHLFSVAVRAGKNFWYNWLKIYLTDFPFEGNPTFSNEPERDRKPISLLSIARVIYAGLKKKGERGRRSAAMKAFIIREIIEADFNRRNVEVGYTSQSRWNRSRDHIISLRSQTLNAHHHITVHSVKKHYQSATAVLFGISRGNITR